MLNAAPVLGPMFANYADNYAQLAVVKAKYDPNNFFHVNQNIRLASAEAPAEQTVAPPTQGAPTA